MEAEHATVSVPKARTGVRGLDDITYGGFPAERCTLLGGPAGCGKTLLALAFLVLIGVALVADGFKFHIPRGYIYFAMLFAAAVELFNVLARRNRRKAAR